MNAKARGLALTSVLLGALLLGCSEDGDDTSGATSNMVNAVTNEWSVVTDAKSAMAGEVTFTVANEGTIGHEFLVVKTDIKDGEIPLAGDHFEEPSPGIEVIDEIGEFAKGTTEKITLTLTAGNYQLVCNLPAHYGAGMHTTFMVK